MKKTFGTAALFALSLAILPQAQADTWDKKTIITVHQAIQVPGAILEPGKYVMKLHGSRDYRNIVQITNERGDKVITTILTIPHYREKQTDKNEFRFWEIAAGQPRPLRAWFYAGDLTGHEFVYPRGFATTIAKASHVDVPAMESEAKTEAALEKVHLELVTDTGAEKALDVPAYSKTEFPKLDIAVAQVVEAQPALETHTAQAADRRADAAAPAHAGRLPDTATAVPVAGLVSLVTLALGIAVARMASHI